MSSPSPPTQRPRTPGGRPRTPVADQQQRPFGNDKPNPPTLKRRTRDVSPVEDHLPKRSKAATNGAMTNGYHSPNPSTSRASTQPLPSRNVATSANESPYLRGRSRETSLHPDLVSRKVMSLQKESTIKLQKKNGSFTDPSTLMSRSRSFSHSGSPESDHGSQYNPISVDSDSDNFERLMDARITGAKPVKKTIKPLEKQGTQNPGRDLGILPTPNKTAEITARIAAKFAAKQELQRSQKGSTNGIPVGLDPTSPKIKEEDLPTPQKTPPPRRTPAKTHQPRVPNRTVVEGEPAWLRGSPWSALAPAEKARDANEKEREAKEKELKAKAKAVEPKTCLPLKRSEANSTPRPLQLPLKFLNPIEKPKLQTTIDSRSSGSLAVKRNSLLDSSIKINRSAVLGRDTGSRTTDTDAASTLFVRDTPLATNGESGRSGAVNEDTPSTLFVRDSPPLKDGHSRFYTSQRDEFVETLGRGSPLTDTRKRMLVGVDMDDLFGEQSKAVTDSSASATRTTSPNTRTQARQAEVERIPGTLENEPTAQAVVHPPTPAPTLTPAPSPTVAPVSVPTRAPVPESAPPPTLVSPLTATIRPTSIPANEHEVNGLAGVTPRPPENTSPRALPQTVEIVRGAYNSPENVIEKRLDRVPEEEQLLRIEMADQEARQQLGQIRRLTEKRDAKKIAAAEEAARARAVFYIEAPVSSASSASKVPLRADGRPQRTWGIGETPVSYAPPPKVAKTTRKPRTSIGPKKVTFAETQQTTYFQKYNSVVQQNATQQQHATQQQLATQWRNAAQWRNVTQQQNGSHSQEDESDISDEDEDGDKSTQKAKPVSPQKCFGASQGGAGPLAARPSQGKPVANKDIPSNSNNQLAISSARRPPIEYPVWVPPDDHRPQYTGKEAVFYEYRVIRSSWRDEGDPPLMFHCGTYFDRESANKAARKQVFPSNSLDALNYDEFHMERDANGMQLYSADTPECTTVVYTELVLRKAEQGPKPDSRATWLNPKVYVVYERYVEYEKRVREEDEDDLFGEFNDGEDDDEAQVKNEKTTMLGIHSKRDLANMVASQHMIARLRQLPDGSKNKAITAAEEIEFEELEGRSRRELDKLDEAKVCYEGNGNFYGVDDEIRVWVEEQDLHGPLN